jgi:hypothetical protein
MLFTNIIAGCPPSQLRKGKIKLIANIATVYPPY